MANIQPRPGSQQEFDNICPPGLAGGFQRPLAPACFRMDQFWTLGDQPLDLIEIAMSGSHEIIDHRLRETGYIIHNRFL